MAGDVEKLGYSFEEAKRATSLGLTTLGHLVRAGVIRSRKVGDRVILNGDDVRRIVVEGYLPGRKTPPVQRGADHWTRKRRAARGEPPEAA